MRRLFRNNKAHAWVVSLLLISTVATLEFPAVSAVSPSAAPLREVTVEAQDSLIPERGSLSTRTPAPVGDARLPSRSSGVRPQVDFPATPKPTPLPTPVAPPPPPPDPTPEPTPTPVLVATVGWPVAGGGGITTYFSLGHQAIDITASCGTAALAVWGGEVVYAGWKENGGGMVVDIQFDNGLLGSYNHLQAIYVGGGRVEAGTVLGEVGSTGISTGCHLHFAVALAGVWVDPLLYL